MDGLYQHSLLPVFLSSHERYTGSKEPQGDFFPSLFDFVSLPPRGSEVYASVSSLLSPTRPTGRSEVYELLKSIPLALIRTCTTETLCLDLSGVFTTLTSQISRAPCRKAISLSDEVSFASWDPLSSDDGPSEFRPLVDWRQLTNGALSVYHCLPWEWYVTPVTVTVGVQHPISWLPRHFESIKRVPVNHPSTIWSQVWVHQTGT